MKTPSVEYQNERYQLDRSTCRFWPQARVIRVPARGLNWQLFVTTEFLENYLASLEEALLSDLSPEASEEERELALQPLDSETCSIEEAIQRIAEDSEEAEDLMVLLKHYFFVKKV